MVIAYRRLVSPSADARLRYSREPVTLFKEGVDISAKPERSLWREVKQLSGGQQAVLSLALSMGVQSVYRSPFYVMDEVDASLDSHHAARAGKVRHRQHWLP